MPGHRFDTRTGYDAVCMVLFKVDLIIAETDVKVNFSFGVLVRVVRAGIMVPRARGYERHDEQTNRRIAGWRPPDRVSSNSRACRSRSPSIPATWT